MNLIEKIINRKYTIDEILNTGVIHCKTEQEMIKVFKVLEEMDLKWATGKELLEKIPWDEYKTETCVEVENGKVYYADCSYYAKYCPSLRIYSFEELAQIENKII